MVTGVALVGDYIRWCALRDCGVRIENIPGRPERRYCTAGHRAAARQVRRAAMRPERRASDPVRPTVVPLDRAAPVDGPADEWAARAEVVLASIDQQLDVIAAIEAAWNTVKGGRAVTPAPIAALADRRGLLERRRAALRSQLDGYRALGPTRTDLERAEQHLDAKRAELAGLESNVERATRTPLPDDGQDITAVTDLVRQLVHGGADRPAVTKGDGSRPAWRPRSGSGRR